MLVLLLPLRSWMNFVGSAALRPLHQHPMCRGSFQSSSHIGAGRLQGKMCQAHRPTAGCATRTSKLKFMPCAIEQLRPIPQVKQWSPVAAARQQLSNEKAPMLQRMDDTVQNCRISRDNRAYRLNSLGACRDGAEANSSVPAVSAGSLPVDELATKCAPHQRAGRFVHVVSDPCQLTCNFTQS